MRTENGIRVLHLQSLKALYGSMDSVILWYNLYTKTLKYHWFDSNPYLKCIENGTKDVKQCKISRYVDDNKVSQVTKEVNTKTIKTIDNCFGELTVTGETKAWKCT